jgi:hypothetical protein
MPIRTEDIVYIHIPPVPDIPNQSPWINVPIPEFLRYQQKIKDRIHPNIELIPPTEIPYIRKNRKVILRREE